MSSVVVGVDVGGTKVLAVAVAAGAPGTVLGQCELPTEASAGGLTAGVVGAARSAARAAGASIAAVGVGMPGLVTLAGRLRYGPNVAGVVDLDIGDAAGPVLGAPVAVDNDGNCAARAEYRLGAGRGRRHLVFAGLGTGISSGLVVDGQLVRGGHGFAGEAGHMTVDRSGPSCACGRQGCWEAVASGTALARLARLAVVEGRAAGVLAAAGGQVDHVRGEHVSVAAASGDPDARTILDRFAAGVAAGLVSVVNLLDPEVIVLGGSVMGGAPGLLGRVRAAYAAEALGGARAAEVRIVAAELGRRAGAVGAALLALDEEAAVRSER